MRLRLLLAVPLLALVAPLAPMSQAAGPITGVDVSKYQHDDGKPINWARVRASGQTFAFIKASGGSNRTDPWFHREWAAARKAGMITGAYHYANPAGSAKEQAAHVVSVVGSTREANNLGIALDLEDAGGLGPGALRSWAHTFLSEVERRTGRVPILYTYPNFWHSRMKDDRSFGAYPLWLARYADKAPEPLPGWPRWTWWQRTSKAHVPGIVGYVDHNRFCCALGTLQALADGRSLTITRVWRALGGASGQLGLPLGPESVVPGGWGQEFEKGYVASTGQGTWPVVGSVYERYKQTGGASGPLGLPIGAEGEIASGIVQQVFQGGRIIWSKDTGAHALRGDMLERWQQQGGVTSPMGLPTGEAGDVSQQFVGGGLYRAPTGLKLVPGAIRDTYEQRGGPRSYYGLPVAEARDTFGGRIVDFQIGQLYEVELAGLRVVI